MSINLSPEVELPVYLKGRSRTVSDLAGVLSGVLPHRFARMWCGQFAPAKPALHYSFKELEMIAGQLHNWVIVPDGTEGYAKAEVTCGGVDTADLSSKTMESRNVPGLFVIGEVVDVTGQLGGFNFQWAWASGFVAGQYC
jgi:predicted flavoprotein YhiN